MDSKTNQPQELIYPMTKKKKFSHFAHFLVVQACTGPVYVGPVAATLVTDGPKIGPGTFKPVIDCLKVLHRPSSSLFIYISFFCMWSIYIYCWSIVRWWSSYYWWTSDVGPAAVIACLVVVYNSRLRVQSSCKYSNNRIKYH